MNTENLSTLKIHKLTQAQYDRELEAGRIDPSALYLTPDNSNTDIYVQSGEPVGVEEGTLWVDMESDGANSDYATKNFVKNEIAKAQLDVETGVDLSGYATKDDIPTKTSQLINNSGYLTSFTETDPTVPAWAKASKKPSYTKSEIGLENVDNVKQYSENNPPPYPVKSVNGKTGTISLNASDVGARPSTWMPSASDIGALPNTTVIPTVPTKVSAFINDIGYLTEHQDISHKLDASALTEAVNDALELAKASGKFNGKDGLDGDDYVLTDSDKDEIAKQVAELVDVSGGTQSDWNANEGEAGHILNRPFYSEPAQDIVVLPETTYDNPLMSPLPALGLVVGETYTITCNGYTFESVAEDGSGNYVNLCYIDVPHENGSFQFVINENQKAGWTDFYAEGDNPPATVTLMISKKSDEETVHKLDPKYLPEGVPYIDETGKLELPVTGEWYEERNDTDGDGVEEVTEAGYTITAPIGLEIDKTYVVNWNGTEYEAVGQDLLLLSGGEMPGVYLGNIAALGGTDNGLPFALIEFPAEIGAQTGLYGFCASVVDLMSINIPFTIYKSGRVVHKLDNELLDLAWKPGETTEVIAIPEQIATYQAGVIMNATDGTVMYKSNAESYYETNSLTSGQNVIVYVDGVRYEAVYVSDATWWAIGDPGGQTIGVKLPFVFNYMEGRLCLYHKEATDHTFSVYTEELAKMPEEFLPICNYVTGMKYIVPQGVYSGYINDFAKIEINIPIDDVLEIGKTYVVNWNGVEYNCKAFNGGGTSVQIGHKDYYTQPFEYPFVGYCSNHGYIAFMVLDDSTKVTISIYGEGKVCKIDNKYLDLTEYATEEYVDNAVSNVVMNSIVIRSSTEGSTKLFRITVDDSGTISATEV